VYLSASFLFFVGSALLPHAPDAEEPETAQVKPADKAADVAKEARPAARVRVRPDETLTEAAARASSGATAKDKLQLKTQWGNCRDRSLEDCSAIERALTRLSDKAGTITQEQGRAKLRALAPYGMLAMQPLFAALLLAMFAGSGRRYAEHFVFSLHSHSLWFLALLLANAADLSAVLMFAVFGHGLVAMRNVYGLGLGAALWRGLLLSAGYFVLLFTVLVAFAAAAVALA